VGQRDALTVDDAQVPSLLEVDQEQAPRREQPSRCEGALPVAARFNPALYALPADVAAVLGDSWRVEVDERRPRSTTGGSGAHHVADLVPRASRR